MNTQQSEAERKLLVLVGEIKGTLIMDRVNAYVAKFGGASGVKTVSEFLAAKMPDKEKYIVTCNLVDILLAKDYDRLPPHSVATPVQAPADADEPQEDEGEDADDPPVDLRAQIRAEVRAELADVFEKIARALKP